MAISMLIYRSTFIPGVNFAWLGNFLAFLDIRPRLVSITVDLNEEPGVLLSVCFDHPRS